MSFNSIKDYPPQSGTSPGYIIMLNGQSGSYTVIYLPATNANNVNEIFEAVEYYNGSADQQAIEFLGSASFCNNTNYGNGQFLSNGYTVSWDPYSRDAYIWSGCALEVAPAESVFTLSGYNFYQAIVTSSVIEYYGQTISSPVVDLPQLSLSQVATWSSTITVNGSAFAIMDDSGGSTHIGYFYWARARKLPPNNVMPTNSQPQKTIILVSWGQTWCSLIQN